MKFFHIVDCNRSLQLVVEAYEDGAGVIVCTTTDPHRASYLTKLLNEDRAAVLAGCAAWEAQQAASRAEQASREGGPS